MAKRIEAIAANLM